VDDSTFSRANLEEWRLFIPNFWGLVEALNNHRRLIFFVAKTIAVPEECSKMNQTLRHDRSSSKFADLEMKEHSGVLLRRHE